jgi:hypothetical protein
MDVVKALQKYVKKRGGDSKKKDALRNLYNCG